MGSITVAAFAARALFVGLLAYAYVRGELKRKTLAVFILLGLGVYVGLSRIPNGARFVTSALAVIDIALVFAIFRGDVRIT
jgi:membrane-associated PAP2 superfamily phosphatase